MGGTQSKLNVFLENKNGTHQSQGYKVTASKTIFTQWINFEVVTHKIDITKYPTYYDVYLYNCKQDQNNSNYIFAYCSPSHFNQVLDIVKVYYSVLAPDIPLVVSFFIKGGQWYNCEYSKLLSVRWDYASNISKYNFSDHLSEEKLFNIYRRISFNKKIKFTIGKEEVVDISKYKQEIDNKTFYRIIYTPTGKESILGSKSLFENTIKTIPSKCPIPKTSESKTAEAKPNGSTKYNNQIDPYYLTSVKNHFFDGIMVYFARDNENKGQANNSGASTATTESNSNGRTGSNGQSEIQKENDQDNMIILLEFVDTYKVKTHIQRIDKLGYSWSEETVKYRDIKALETALNAIKESANKNESITFILEKKEPYVGVTEVTQEEKNKSTYTKYKHKGTPSNKPNIIYEREVVRNIGNFNLSFNTTILDVYFLKTTASTDKWPFILMFKNENTDKPPPEPKKHKNRCFYFGNTHNFDDWKELTVTKKSKEEEKKLEKPEGELDKLLDKKLKDKLDKIETNGKCQTELYLLRSIAFYILSTDDVKEEEIKKKLEERPPLQPPFVQPGMGRSLPFILGSVAGGLVVLGTLSAIIYGIYWYNTTIKLLT